jgi:ADP-heptose:LPS heptosyltransferase
MEQKKILVIRFSSIGDIVLTTPVIRCLKQQVKNVIVHYVTKESFRETLIHNPYIDKLHTFKKDVSEIYPELKAEKYDYVIDLHKNLRSLRLKQQLNAKSFSFDKINLRKFIAVNFKILDSLPDKHIVERYFEATAPLYVVPDNKGLDYFLSEGDSVNVNAIYFKNSETKYTALVVGGSYYTKKIPLEKLEEICSKIKTSIIALGNKDDKNISEVLEKKFPNVINACGEYSINQSASIIKQADMVITSDTGLMHIAAAFNKKIISLWGNTIPEFGMGPYLPNKENKILEIKDLSCRPCSKLGYKSCPKGHFKCMMDIDVSKINV